MCGRVRGAWRPRGPRANGSPHSKTPFEQVHGAKEAEHVREKNFLVWLRILDRERSAFGGSGLRRGGPLPLRPKCGAARRPSRNRGTDFQPDSRQRP